MTETIAARGTRPAVPRVGECRLQHQGPLGLRFGLVELVISASTSCRTRCGVLQP